MKDTNKLWQFDGLQPVRNPCTVIEALTTCMKQPQVKNMRVGQVISNALIIHLGASFQNDIFYVEDSVLIAALYGYLGWMSNAEVK